MLSSGGGMSELPAAMAGNLDDPERYVELNSSDKRAWTIDHDSWPAYLAMVFEQERRRTATS